MKDYLSNEMQNAKGQTYITDIPIEEFDGIEELTDFVKKTKRHGLGTVLHYETSNFHQGVVVQIFDKETCKHKSFLGV